MADTCGAAPTTPEVLDEPPGCGDQTQAARDERGLDRQLLTQLGTCSFVGRQQNVVLQGFTGSGKSYLGCAVAKRACEHRIRAHYGPDAQPRGRMGRRARQARRVW